MFLKKTKTIQFKQNFPEDTLIYAIGDIHGSLDLLVKMHEKIINDARNYSAKRKVIIYLGDYIDRGLYSKEVIDLLANHKLENFKQIFLKGNHEAALINFLENPNSGVAWLSWGGEATLSSYGVKIRDETNQKIKPEDLSNNMSNNFPESHRNFLFNLKLYHEEGNYFFVHAGIDPDKPIAKQDERDMLTIRDEFIFSSKKLEKTIIFGHTIFDEPFNETGKIGIDTGAYSSGKLSAIRIWQDNIGFITSHR